MLLLFVFCGFSCLLLFGVGSGGFCLRSEILLVVVTFVQFVGFESVSSRYVVIVLV